jgi:L-aminopeptidase/D-esterase-like protein
MKGGLGTASVNLGNGVVVGALVAVNAYGDVFDPAANAILAGCRASNANPPVFADALEVMRQRVTDPPVGFGRPAASEGHTVIGVVASNAQLTKEETNKVAQMAHDGLARVIRPAHTMFDGDTIFALSTGDKVVDVNIIGAFAAEALAQAIIGGVRAAVGVPGWPAVGDQ